MNDTKSGNESSFDAESYFQKWDHTVMIIMTVLALGMTAGAVVLNIMNQQAKAECSEAEYVYCGVDNPEPHH